MFKKLFALVKATVFALIVSLLGLGYTELPEFSSENQEKRQRSEAD